MAFNQVSLAERRNLGLCVYVFIGLFLRFRRFHQLIGDNDDDDDNDENGDWD